MSRGNRQQPFTPKGVESPKPSEPTAPRTCSECKHWRGEPDGDPDRKGKCTKNPPTISLGVVDMPDGSRLGPILTYGYTPANELACGQAEPK